MFYTKTSEAVVTVKKSENIANTGPGKKPATVYLFHTSWCGACKRAKPTWDAFVNAYSQDLVVGDYAVTFTDVKCDDSNDVNVQEMMIKYDVRHYPTVKLVVKDNIVDLDGSITKENLDRLVAHLQTF